MNIKYLILALALIGFVSCNNDKDESNPAPTIENYTVSGHDDHDHARLAEDDHAHIVPGEEAVVEADTKGTKLNYAQIDVHWGAGHEHSNERTTETEEGVQWTQKYTYWFGISAEEAEAKGAYNYALTAAGDFPNEYEFHEHIDVPTTWTKDGVTGPVKEGDYHFVLFLVDSEGQRTQKALTVEVHAEEHDHQ
ncbi:DUF4625 domain-containing protein [Flammeovirga pacifica]|uniref:DUF4625 domain-containing protein n=1 Tax=Flammeovirga pacifica TaxID=915059 RepID=A0A1S1YV67_FLAPC|nr:DUF4625 domain-containing protein [Flammeovirga pacifica]OHX64911.1 hypothetical protein NH26_00400 [Flammeovirga pacifica]